MLASSRSADINRSAALSCSCLVIVAPPLLLDFFQLVKQCGEFVRLFYAVNIAAVFAHALNGVFVELPGIVLIISGNEIPVSVISEVVPVLVLNANGGTIDSKESNKYDYVGGADSGTSMSLLPYTPVREGYTFTGWNTKSDGSGKNLTYIYWRLWDKDNEIETEKDTILYDSEGYIAYQNLTLYASWAKNADTPTEPDEPVTPSQPTQDTVKKIQSTGDIKANIEFADGINKDYRLDIQEIKVRKELADKNVKFIADINVMDGNTVVKISDTKMKIRIALPEDVKGYDKYEVVYILDDEIKETIPAMVEDGYIVFETNHLSQYGIIATNTGTTAGGSETANPQTDNNGKATQNTDATSPQTGDNSNLALWFAVLFVSCTGVLGTTVYSKRKRKAE